MTVDYQIIKKRTHEILSIIKELKDFSNISEDEFYKNKERQYAVMHLLQRAIEACISLNNHIIARRRLGTPENYQDTFALLEKEGILTAEFTNEMRKMARFRNLLVHVYWEIDLDQIYEILTTRLNDFKTYVSMIKKAFPD